MFGIFYAVKHKLFHVKHRSVMRRIVKENDIVKATAIDRNGKYIVSLYDCGFDNISQVCYAIAYKSDRIRKKVSEVWISNESRNWRGCYYANGRRKE